MIQDSPAVLQDKSQPRKPLTDLAPREQPPSLVSPSSLDRTVKVWEVENDQEAHH